MDAEADGWRVVVASDVLGTHRFEHFDGVGPHVEAHVSFVFPELCVGDDERQPPFVLLVGVEKDPVIMIGQALAEAAHVDLPGTDRGELFFEIHAEAIDLAGPVLAQAAALVAITAAVVVIGRFRMIAEAGNVETVRAATVGGLVRVGFQNAIRADAEVVVH